jgi:hypothetical protein
LFLFLFLPDLPSLFPNPIPSSFSPFLISCTLLPLYTSCLSFLLFVRHLFNSHRITKSYFSWV